MIEFLTSGLDSDGEPEVAPIVRRSLHEEIVTRLRDLIIEGRLPPGVRINEVAVGKLLQVSRTPLREAIKRLASEGLIELVPTRGAVVRTFTAKDVEDILAVLSALEQLAARQICAHASDAEIGQICALHDAMMERYAARDRLAYFKLNQEIHSTIVELTGNQTLAKTHGSLQACIRRIRFVGNERPDKWASAVAEHEEMVAALRARDGERLAGILDRHMRNTQTRVATHVTP
ncbi:GntR family transcriptional regulator [Ferrovibrio sp.]|uniref:GntR family transcriptional regulator n=1 Tax=Ferrovibrio sp. TaxID=1917215 RepID=UPI003D2C02B5